MGSGCEDGVGFSQGELIKYPTSALRPGAQRNMGMVLQVGFLPLIKRKHKKRICCGSFRVEARSKESNENFSLVGAGGGWPCSLTRRRGSGRTCQFQAVGNKYMVQADRLGLELSGANLSRRLLGQD